jgi:DNA-binding CsgD family transcriptional regulator
MESVGLVEILEAAYAIDRDEQAWMQATGAAVDANLQYGKGLIASRYRVDAENRFHPYAMQPINLGAEVLQRMAAFELPPDYVDNTYRTICGVATQVGNEAARKHTRDFFQSSLAPVGVEDCMTINGLDPTGNGFMLAVWLPRTVKLTAWAKTRWTRVAAHLAAANRLRQRLDASKAKTPESAEAILNAWGKVEHADGEAKSAEARTQLEEGARQMDRARGSLRKSDPDLAIAEWRGLIAARWTLVDHYESDGKRYLLARRNEATPSGFAALSLRERQAVGYACLRHSNKLIAYEMGISPSTVGVLLHRAAGKLGAHTRDEMVALFSKGL